ncbi:TPA: hypothetical protein QDB10_002197 [Burkholderia vietnamiensis]|nr:hypothetical protein [Burkholderia vietnamiensis]
MLTIHKFALNAGVTVIELPADAHVLTAQQHHGRASIWVKLVTDSPRVKRRFYLALTGEQLPEYLNTALYVGTVQAGGDMGFSLSGHIFEYFQPTKEEA